MKKIIKNPLFMFILGALIFGGVALAYAYDAKDVGYKSTNVENALDDLYDLANKEILNKLTLKIRTESFSPTVHSVTNYGISNTPSILNNYSYFKVTGVTSDNIKSYAIDGYSKRQSGIVSISLNTEYELADVDNIWVTVYSNNTNTGYVIPTVEFYNK